jgi:hypothetical protein
MTRSPEDIDRFRFALVPIDQAMHASELKWGVSRLERLVSPATLASYKRGWDAYRAAIETCDADAITTLAPKMCAALAYMDREATDAGHPPLDALACVWEAPMADGSVLLVVRTLAEAHAVSRAVSGRESGLPPDITITIRDHLHHGRSLIVVSLSEVAYLMATHGSVASIKTNFPGATITGTTWQGDAASSAVQLGEGDIADVVRSGYPLDAPMLDF